MIHPNEMITETDADLLRQASRSPECFAAVFDRHYGHIYAYAARRLGRDLAEDEPADAHDDLAAARVDALAARGRLARALARLPRAERDVLLLVAWAGLSQQEAAAALDIPAGTARSRLHRARREMKLALGAEVEE